MTFADPSTCPDCGSVLEGGSSCPSCRLDLTSDAARQLWAALQSADAWLEEARRYRVPLAPPTPSVSTAPEVPRPDDAMVARFLEAASATATRSDGPGVTPTSDLGIDHGTEPQVDEPQVDEPRPAASDGAVGPDVPRFPVGPDAPVGRAPRRRLSVGTVLLALGALSLVVAAIIFIAVYWGPMGILGRAAVLFAVTLLIGGFAVTVTRRGLRGSSEALWSVFLAFLSLDWLLSRSQGLFGLDTAPAAPVELAWATVMVVLGVATIRLGRRHLPRAAPESGRPTPLDPSDTTVRSADVAGPPSVDSPPGPSSHVVQPGSRAADLVAPSVLAGLAVAYALLRRLDELADTVLWPFWALATIAAASVGAALLLRRLGLRLGAVVVAAAAGLTAGLAVVSAYGTAVTNPAADDLVLRGEGLPLALVSLTLLIGSVAARGRAAIASVLAAAGTVSAVVLVTLPVADAWSATGVLLLHAALGCVLVVATGASGSGAVRRGVRWAAVGPAAVALVGLVVDSTALVALTGSSVERAGSLTIADRVALGPPFTSDAWRAVVVGILLAASTVYAARTSRTIHRTHALTVAQLLALAGLAATVALLGPPVVVMSAVVVVGGLLIGLLGGPTLSVRLVIGATLASVGPVVALASWWGTAISAATAAAALAWLAARVPVARWREVGGAVATGWALGGLVAGLTAAEVAPQVAAYVLAGSALAALVVAILLLGPPTGRAGVEVAAAVWALVALERVSATSSLGEQSVVLLAAAAVLVALGLCAAERWWYAVVGSVAAVAAAVLVTGAATGVLWDWAAAVWPVASVIVLVAVRGMPAGALREVAAGAGALLAGGSTVPPVVLLDLPTVVQAAVLVAAAAAVASVALTRGTGRSGAVGAEVAAGVLALLGLSMALAELSLPQGVGVALATGAVVVALAWTVSRRAWYSLLGAALAWSCLATTLGTWSTAVWAWPAAGLLLAAAAAPLARWWRDGVAGSAAFVLAMSVLPALRLLQTDELVVTSAVLLAAAVAVGVAHHVLGAARGGLGVEVGGGAAALTTILAAVGALTPESFAVAALLVGVLATSLAWLVHGRRWYALVGTGAACISVLCSVEATGTALWVWPAATVVVAGGAARVAGWPRQLLAGIAAVLVGACVRPVADAAGLDVATVTLLLVGVAAVLAAVAVLILHGPRGGAGIEVGAAILAASSLLLGAEWTGPAHVALLLTVVGAVTALLSLLSSEREWYRWIGAAALALAYVLRLVASEVGVVEAYTLPFGVLLLLAGVFVTVRAADPSRRTLVTLGPGLLLTLAPSLPLALADPTSLRALLLGLAALTVMAAGIVARWQAPFVAGALVVAAVVLTNVGPYAWGLPRWVLIAVAGAAMLVTGVTWERRVQDGRAAVRWVGAMR